MGMYSADINFDMVSKCWGMSEPIGMMCRRWFLTDGRRYGGREQVEEREREKSQRGESRIRVNGHVPHCVSTCSFFISPKVEQGTLASQTESLHLVRVK